MSEEQAKYSTGKNVPEVKQPTYSQRFTGMVVREFGSTVGNLELSPYKHVLAQHLFIGIDTALRNLEAKRLKDGKEGKPIAWANINMNKLAVDAVHRVELGLDALIPGHIYPIPYFNGKLGLYDLDLRIGYVGKDYYRRKYTTVPPVDVIYQLVHAKDKFVPIVQPGAESYTFEIPLPFNRGEVVGGFGYIVHEDPSKNKLILVSKADFDKSRNAAKSKDFWGPYEREMQFKTLVNRVTSKLPIDPEKVNASFAAVEIDEAQAESEREIAQHANGDLLDVTGTGGENGGEMSEEEKAAIMEEEALMDQAGKQPQAAGKGPEF